MGTITLLTDFGEKDPYAGIMKGVILGIDPSACIVDITHKVGPQDIREAAFLVDEYYRYFPKGTVHVVVVDPGVGGDRRPIIVSRSGHHFVGPDNGVFTFIADAASEIRVIENRNFMLPSISSTFHGRDIFAPAAARLARGFYPFAFGRQVTDPVVLTGLNPVADGSTLHGEVVRFDSFGNALTNIKTGTFRSFTKGHTFEITIGGLSFTSIDRTYCANEFTCLAGSAGFIEFGVFQGNFKERTDTHKGDPVTVRI